MIPGMGATRGKAGCPVNLLTATPYLLARDFLGGGVDNSSPFRVSRRFAAYFQATRPIGRQHQQCVRIKAIGWSMPASSPHRAASVPRSRAPVHWGASRTRGLSAHEKLRPVLPSRAQAERGFGRQPSGCVQFVDDLFSERYVDGWNGGTNTHDSALVVDVDQFSKELVEHLRVDNGDGLKPCPQVESTKRQAGAEDPQAALMASSFE
jgi:hypothetical protein